MSRPSGPSPAPRGTRNLTMYDTLKRAREEGIEVTLLLEHGHSIGGKIIEANNSNLLILPPVIFGGQDEYLIPEARIVAVRLNAKPSESF